MFSAIVQTGQLPNGVYTFRVVATSENGEQIVKEDVLNIFNPAQKKCAKDFCHFNITVVIADTFCTSARTG